ncbi:hypothetical protein Tco_0650145 [Tanacetum coccineum]
MTAFWVVKNQFQKFIDSKFTLDYDSQMTDMYFVEYTGIEVQHFRDTLLQHLGNVKKVCSLNSKALGQTSQQLKDDTAGLAMIQYADEQISDPYMTKSQWLRFRKMVFAIAALKNDLKEV